MGNQDVDFGDQVNEVVYFRRGRGMYPHCPLEDNS